MNTKQVLAETLSVGSLIEIGGKAHRVTKLTAYPNFGHLCPGYTARLADCDTGYGITLIDGHLYRVPAFNAESAAQAAVQA